MYPRHGHHGHHNPLPVQPQPQNQLSAAQRQDLDTLHQCFPSVEKIVIESVYAETGSNFEKSYKVIEEMEGINQVQKGMSRIQISPEKKLLFMKMVFDKLDPTLIEAILQHHKWSVEGALDDLLAKEDERCRIEAEQRRQLEAQRWQQYEAERQRFLAQQQDLERRNMVFNLRAIFPHLPEPQIQQALSSYGWSYKDAYAYLYPFEMQAVQAEQYERQRKEEEFRQQQLRDQELRLQQAAAAAAQSDSMLQGVQNWDQLYQKFEQPDAGAVSDQKEERRFFVDLAAQFWHLDPAKVTHIYENAHWDLKAAYPVLEQTSFQEFKTKLQAQFPSLPPQQVEPILSQCFPNHGKAVKELGYQSRMQLLEQAMRDCRVRLDDARKRQGQTQALFGAQQAKWAQQQAELQRVPPSERAFMESAYQMVQQKEDLHFKSLFADHDKEIAKLQKELQDIQNEMDEKTRQNNQEKTPELTPEQRLKAFEDKIAAYKAQRKVDQVANVQVKKSLIAEKLRNQLGEEKFGNLVRVLGEAPGGVAMGWRGPAELQNREVTSPRKTSGGAPSTVPAPSTPAPAVHPPSPAKPTFAPTVLNPQFAGSSSGIPPAPTPSTSNYPSNYSSSNLPAPPSYGAPLQPNQTNQAPTQTSSQPGVSSNIPAAGYPPGYPPAYSTQPTNPNPAFASSYGQPTNPPPAYGSQQVKDEVTQFNEWWIIADRSRSGYVGMQDAGFFRRSLLPDNILAEVWRLSSNASGRLDRNQFALALNLIYLAQIRAPLSLEYLAQYKTTNQPMIPYLKFD